MIETRAGKYGRFLAEWIDYTMDTLPIDTIHKGDYRREFLQELKTYSLEYRKKGEPKNSGCVYELTNLDGLNPMNPVELARFVKEGIHLMYQKNTAKKTLDALIEYL